jgi:SsrA-binding protein
MNKKNPLKISNKKAYFDYKIADTFEVGMALKGAEIKAIRAKHLKIDGSHVRVLGGNLVWLGANFGGNVEDKDRTIQLLAKRSEIDKIVGMISREGMTVVPINVHMKRGFAKLDIGIGRGKKKHDKRETIKKRDVDREARAAEKTVSNNIR